MYSIQDVTNCIISKENEDKYVNNDIVSKVIKLLRLMRDKADDKKNNTLDANVLKEDNLVFNICEVYIGYKERNMADAYAFITKILRSIPDVNHFLTIGYRTYSGKDNISDYLQWEFQDMYGYIQDMNPTEKSIQDMLTTRMNKEPAHYEFYNHKRVVVYYTSLGKYLLLPLIETTNNIITNELLYITLV